MRYRLAAIAVVIALGFLPSAFVLAHEDERGTIEGQVIEASSGEVLPGANISIRGTELGQATDSSGRFSFDNLAAGTYEVRATFVGFNAEQKEVELGAGETVELLFTLRESSLDLPDVVVTSARAERGISAVYRPASVVAGDELQRRVSSSVPATLSRVPGFSMEYNGPGAARPTIRGMGSDRVLMLEDGQRSGDLYQTASDHGVMVEPLSAERMEVVRGPAGLLYSPAALGGVVNVIRDDIPRERPSTITGTISSQLETVNEGVSGGAVTTVPIGPFAVRAEITARGAGDTQTPEGPLPASDMRVYNGSIGASLIQDWGFVGAAYRYYDNVYGVPGEFNGQLIPGAHPGGVDIEAQRHVARVRAAYQEELFNFFTSLEFDANFTRYEHDEIEVRQEDGDDFFGARFVQNSGEANFVARHDHENGRFQTEGAFGLSFHARDLTAGGNSPGTRSGDDWTVAAFAFEEFELAPARLQVGARYDYRDVRVRDQSDIRLPSRLIVGSDEDILKPVENRTFGNFSGSVAVLYDFAPDWTIGASFSRSFRSPAIEELYSDGPHLADFSFDIGEPDLDEEVGLGADLFLRAERSRLSLELAGFYNRVQNYIYYRPTGFNTVVGRETGDRLTPIFEAQGDDAEFLGAEGRIQWEPLDNFVLDVTGSYTRATRIDDGDPLPAISPLTLKTELRYDGERFFGNVGLDTAAPQNRVPDRIQVGDRMERPEEPTDGYGIVHAGIGARHHIGGQLHTLSLQVQNLTNEVYRDHQSRIKDVAPNPGRNFRLTYRVLF